MADPTELRKMGLPTCPYCGDGTESIGTLNHIECVGDLMQKRAAEKQRADEAEAAAEIMSRHRNDFYERAIAAEAKLAAAEATVERRCWTCRNHVYLSHGGNAYKSDSAVACPMFGRGFEADGFCHHWAERGPA